jgi:ribose-phosphate pyrophosphokinase
MPGVQIKLFTGSANPELARSIADILDLALEPVRLERFSDGELFVEIGANVRSTDVFVCQSTSQPANEHLMELLIMIDALKRASAKSICAIIPYYGYARQDRKVHPRTPITAKLVADLITRAGASRVLSVDLHAGQIQGFFDIPFDHLYAKPVLLRDIEKHYDKEEMVVVSPDAGGVERARAYAKRLGVGLAIIDKRRPEPNVAEVVNLVGNVVGKTAIIVDDMVDTGGTLVHSAEALKNQGAKRVVAYASHGVLSGPALTRLNESEALERVVFTDTISLTKARQSCKKIESISIAPLLAKAVRRIYLGESVSSLFV